MATNSEEGVSLGEVYRLIQRVETELRDYKSNYVPRGEYETHRVSHGERVGIIEAEVHEIQGTLRTINRMAWTAIVMGIMIPLIIAFLLTSAGWG